MKSIFYLPVATALLAASFSSCDKAEIPYYEGMDAIFFDQQYFGKDNETWGQADTTTLAHKLYTPVQFMQANRQDTVLAIKIETTGFVRDYPRPFGIHVVADSTSAVEGVDFELLDDSYAILPGNNSTYLHVKVNLTERMYLQQLQIQLALDPGEHFTLPFGEKGIGQIPKRYFDKDEVGPVPDSKNLDPSVHNIFADCLLSKPSQWTLAGNVYSWGEYSNEKFALILELVKPRGWTAATFNNYYTMQTERQGVVNRELAKYLRAQYDKGEYVLEADGTLMWIKNSTLVTWGAGVTPADIENNK